MQKKRALNAHSYNFNVSNEPVIDTAILCANKNNNTYVQLAINLFYIPAGTHRHTSR